MSLSEENTRVSDIIDMWLIEHGADGLCKDVEFRDFRHACHCEIPHTMPRPDCPLKTCWPYWEGSWELRGENSEREREAHV